MYGGWKAIAIFIEPLPVGLCACGGALQLIAAGGRADGGSFEAGPRYWGVLIRSIRIQFRSGTFRGRKARPLQDGGMMRRLAVAGHLARRIPAQFARKSGLPPGIPGFLPCYSASAGAHPATQCVQRTKNP